MRTLIAGAAMAALVAGCAPDSEKTNPAVATEEATAQREATAPAAGANSFTQEQARERATAAGYMEVGALTQGADGAWQGSAMKNGASVTVLVDYQGNVTEQAGAMPPATGSTEPMPATPSPTSGATPAPTTPQ